MSALVRRIIVFAGATPNPRMEGQPQIALVQGVVAIRIEPPLIEYTALAVAPNPDFWDVLVNPNFDADAYVRLYDAEMQDTGEIIVKRDLFGKDDYPHTWAGWPIPGDPPPVVPPPPSTDAATPDSIPVPDAPQAREALSPQSREYKALAPVRAKKGKK